jgi:tetratricopeptide (TPR) repeat protein
VALLGGAGCAAHRPDAVRPALTLIRTDARTLETSDPRLDAALKAFGGSGTSDSARGVAAEYRRLGVYDEAERRLTRALDRDPANVALLDELARTWRDAGFPQFALAPAYRAVYLNRRSAESQNTLGTVLFALGETAAAARRFEIAAAIDPGAAHAWANTCVALLALGRPADARQACDRALVIDPDLAAARLARDQAVAAEPQED